MQRTAPAIEWVGWGVAAWLLVAGGNAVAAMPADSVYVSYVTQPDSLTVGDAVTLEIRAITPPATRVQFPREVPADPRLDVTGLQVLPAAVTPDSHLAWVGRYTVSVYDVGDVTLPPWPVRVQAESLQTTVYTDSIHILVRSVQNDSLAAAGFLDLKKQRNLDVPLPRWIWVVLVAVVLCAVLLALWIRRRRRRPHLVPIVPPKPPHEVALAALTALEQARLPASGRIKEHYVRLSEILRRYLENPSTFDIPALEQTTDEIRTDLTARAFAEEIVKRVVDLCDEADLVKFAKHEPTIAECNHAMQRVRDFVLETTSKPPRPAPASLEAVGAEVAT